MANYEIDTLGLIPGESPKQKFENMKYIMDLLSSIAYPKRGTDESYWDIHNVVTKINERNLITL